MQQLKEKIDAKNKEPSIEEEEMNEDQVKIDATHSIEGVKMNEEQVKIDAPNNIEGIKMNDEQVKAWFDREKIDSSITEHVGTCNGQMLKQLWELKHTFPHFFTQPLKEKLKNKSNQDELIKIFSEALEKLFVSK